MLVTYNQVFLFHSGTLYSSCQATNGRFGLAVPVMILRGSVGVLYICTRRDLIGWNLTNRELRRFLTIC